MPPGALIGAPVCSPHERAPLPSDTLARAVRSESLSGLVQDRREKAPRV